MAVPFHSIFGLSDGQGGAFPAPNGPVERDAEDADEAGRGLVVDGTSLGAALPADLRSPAVTLPETVELALDEAEVDWAKGEVVTRLACIYRATPQYFTRPVVKEMDRPVTLVLASLGSVLPPAPFARPLVEPLQLSAFGASPGPAGLGSPLPQNPETAPLSPFLAAITGAGPVAPPAPPVPAPVFDEAHFVAPVVPAELPPAPEEAPGAGEPTLRFGLRSLLSAVDPSVLGLNPSAIPLEWSARLPVSFIKPQIATGQVFATLSYLLEHADASARTVLQGVPGGLEVGIPLPEVFRQLPVGDGRTVAQPAPSPMESGEPPVGGLVTPFRLQAEEETRRGFVPLAVAPPVQMDPTHPVPSPFTMVSPEPAPPMDAKGPEGFESLDDLVAEVPEPAPLPVREAKVVAVPPSETRESPLPAGKGASEERWVRFDGVGFPAPLPDLELRAVFGRSERFTRQLAVDLAGALPGVEGCVLFATGGSGVWAKALPADREGQALAERLPRMHGRIHGLAEDLGFESGDTFTLRTSQGIASFFTHGPACLGVLHRDEPFDPGVWEKLVLVARGCAALPE